MKSLFLQNKKLGFSLIFFILLLTALPAQAVDYTFPGSLPAGCVNNGGGSYACGALSLAAGDTVTIATPKPATITFSGAFVTGAGVFINAGGSISDLKLVVNGAVTIGAGSLVYANMQTLGAGDVTIGVDSWIGGSFSTETGYVVIGATSTIKTGVGGNITTLTGYISMGAGSVINGSVTTKDAGYVALGANANVGGSIATQGAGYVVVGANAIVSGSISSQEYVTLGDGAKVSGSIRIGAAPGIYKSPLIYRRENY